MRDVPPTTILEAVFYPVWRLNVLTSRVLLVDDELDFRNMVALGLESEGFVVLTAADGEDALERLDEAPVDVLVSDVNMPGLDGFALCRRIRESDSELPIILLTTRDSEIDEALGLDLGADDYVTKPVSNRVLAARVRALLRRRDARASERESERLVHRRIALEIERLEATLDGHPVDLTVTEFRLLRCFVDNPGRVLTRERLLRAMRDDDTFVSDRMVDSYVNRLRRKLEAVAADFDEIETVIGMGYRLHD